MKVSDYVAQFLAARGVRHIFTICGGNSMFINDSLGHHPDIESVYMLHEQAAAIAAEAYAAADGKIGVCCTTSGPGATNAITGCLAAWLDSTPVLFLSGQVKRADSAGESGLRQLGFQEAPIIAMVKPITKYAVSISDPTHIRHALEKAFYLMKADRPGPVWIEIPLDVQAVEIEPAKCPGFGDGSKLHVYRPELAAVVSEIAFKIYAAKRPVMLVGNGVRRAGAVESFRKLLEQVAIPVLTTRQGCDLVPYNHPLHAGMPGVFASRGANWTMQRADVLLILGARMDRAMTAYAPEKLAPNATKIMVDIDAAEIAKIPNVMPVVADVGDVIERLRSRLPGFGNLNWLHQVQEWKSEYPIVQPRHFQNHTDGPDLVSVYAFSKALSDGLASDDVILPGSSGTASEIFLTAFQSRFSQRVFHNKGTGAMGLCQPAAIGAALATGRRVVCIDGDGGFQMNIQELETIRRLNLNVKFFIINNGGYASIRSSQNKHFKRLAGADRESGLTLPDLRSVCRAHGIHAQRIFGEMLAADLRSALSHRSPAVYEIMAINNEDREPLVQTIVDANGTIRSGDLENMWPFL